MKILIRALVFVLLALIFLPLAYLAVAFGLAYFPANNDKMLEPAVVRAYITSNGVHTDFVFPITSEWMDWRTLFPFADFKAPESLLANNVDVIMVGWGDEQFYLQTPTWGDLTLPTALGAVSGSNPSLIHVTYYWERALPESTYILPLDAQQYQILIDYVKNTLQWQNQQPVALGNSGYGSYDTFYRAQGSYSLFSTCNTWIGEGMQQAGVPVSRWTPFVDNVTKQLTVRE